MAEREDPIGSSPAQGPGLGPVRAVVSGVALAVGAGGVVLLLVAGARWAAVAIDAVMAVRMLRQAVSSLPAQGRLRRAVRGVVADGGVAVRERDPEQGRAERERLRLRTASLIAAALALSAALTGAALARPWLLLSVAAAGWYLLLAPKLPGLRDRAGLPPLSQSGQSLRDVADSIPWLSRNWYVAGDRPVAPVTVALACAGMVLGTVGTFVAVDGRAVTVGDVTLTIGPGQAGTVAAPQPSPGLPAAGPAGGQPQGQAAPPAPAAERPTCAAYEVVSADLRQGGAPDGVAADLEAAWRRGNWPTLGCVAGPPLRTGAAWIARLEGPASGTSLLVHVGGSARTVHDTFAGAVLAVAPQLTGLSESVEFGAGRHHFVRLGRTCGLVVSSPARGALLVPEPVVADAVRRSSQLGAYPWISDVEADGGWTVLMLVVTAGRPGYLAATTVVVSETDSPPAPAPAMTQCDDLELALERLAAPLAASAAQHR